MRRFLTLLFLFHFWGGDFSREALGQESSLVFLPAGHVFPPLAADPREPKNSLSLSPGFDRFDGALGGTLDLVLWTLPDGSRWSWGALGGGNLLIQRLYWASFRLEDIDLRVGTFVGESSGYFSNRLEWFRVTSHLGDGYFLDDPGLLPVAYRREGLRFVDSFQPNDFFRLYGGLGKWLGAVPDTPPFFAQLGMEIYTGYTPMDGQWFQFFLMNDLKFNYDEEGRWDWNSGLGIRWTSKDVKSPSLRLAVLYARGKGLYGQFSKQEDDHLGIAFFVDP